MRYLHKENLSRIEEELTQRLVEHLRVDLRTLLYDATNFDTFIDSTNPAELPQRGNAKSKRTDLRLVSLALMVSADFGIPLFSHLYPGNQADSVTFSQLVGPLAERCRKFAKETKDITIVFDKGNNSADNIGELANTPYHFIGALVASQHQDLLDIPLHQFSPAGHPRLEGVLAYRTRKKVYGNEYTIVIARSPGLLHGQLRGIDQHLKKKLRRVRCLQCKLRRSQKPGARGKGYSLTSLQKQCEEIQKGQYISEFLKLSPQEEEGRLFLHYHIDRQALERLTERQLGKTLIFTDNHDWTTPDIILGYRGQYRIEKAFRQMKDHHCLTFSPMHHWTDPMIRVHAFYCVVGYTLSALLQRRLAHAGIHLSIRQAMKFLSRIKEILLLYPVTDAKTGKRGKGRPRVEHVLSSLNRTQTALYKTLGLAKHFP
jgi:transposase